MNNCTEMILNQVQKQLSNNDSSNQLISNTLKIQFTNQNINLMNNPHSHQHNHSQIKNDFKPFQYSMNSSYSLHSYFSSTDIQYQTSIKDYSLPCSQSNQRIRTQSIENIEPLLLPRQIKLIPVEEQSQQRNFLKNKDKQDLLDSQMMNQIIKDLNSPQNQQKNPIQTNRKTYRSYLHQVVDKNHLESPTRHSKNNQSQKDIDIPELVLQPSQQKQQNSINKVQDFSNKNYSQYTDSQQSPKYQPVIKPILVQCKQSQSQKSLSQSPNKSPNQSSQQSPKQKSKHHHLQIRKIPSTLYESYDQLTLTINKSEFQQKNRMNGALKLKQKSNQNVQKEKKLKQNQKLKQSQTLKQRKSDKISVKSKKCHIDQELLVPLPIIQGYCRLKTDGSNIYQTKYIINKNTIFFQTFKRLIISQITKVKFINRQENQILIKITYELQQNQKPQNFLITIITDCQDNYFNLSYELFSQIILRKILLMKLSINQLNETYQNESFNKSPSSSPISSPLTLSNTLSRKPSKTIQNQSQGSILLNSELYKKSTFFNSWQKKYFTITHYGLQSYASAIIKGQKQKPSTQLNKTHEIWTRFELTYGYLVIKMWQNKIEKIQMGIPLCNFTNIEGKNNWLFGLSKYVVWKKNIDKEQKSQIIII